MNETHKGDFGRFVASARRRVGLTQKELAAQIYVTESAVSKWERGLSYPDIATLSTLARTLQVTEGELVQASEDRQGRLDARHARSHRRWRGAVLWSAIAILGAGVAASFVVNLSVEHSLSWFWVVLAAAALAFSLTALPLLVARHRGWLAFLGAFVSLAALLGVVELLYGGGFLAITLSSIGLAAIVIWGPLALRSFAPLPLRRHSTVVALAADSIALCALLAVVLAAVGREELFAPIALPLSMFGLSLVWVPALLLRYLAVPGLMRAGIVCAFAAAAVTLITPLVAVVLDGADFRWAPFAFMTWGSANLNTNVTTLIAGALLATGLALVATGALRAAREAGGDARTAG